MKYPLVIAFLCLSFSSLAQREASNWFFGEKLGLRFYESSPTAVQFGELNTLEGCASISDDVGNLLFYTDGSTVWTRNHQVMPNGTNLLGDESSTQSAIIVPKPKDPNIYYLFTVGSTIVPSGFHYYEVDMSLNNGFGDVVGNEKNLTDGHGGNLWSEKITAVQGGECNTFWVISLVVDLFYAYKIDENGVDINAVITQVDFKSDKSRGYLKVSPNGKKLASAHQGSDSRYHGLYLYDFDNITGIVSNEINLFPNEIRQTYGVEFSSLTTKLYASTILNDLYHLYQFDLTSANIPRSAILIHSEDLVFRGALQLGPDLKIYATIPKEYTVGTSYIDVIHNPELLGNACGFQEDYINLGKENFAMQGLPPFIQSFFYIAEINIVNPFEPVTFTSKELSICTGDSYILEGEEIIGAEYKWTFDNGTTVTDLRTPTPPHKLTINDLGVNVVGVYTLTIDTNDECDTQLIGEANITFTDPPIINANVSLSACDLFDNNPLDGLTTFNLENSLLDISNGNPDGFNAYFYLSDTEAENDIHNQNALPSVYANTVPNQTITAKVFKNNSSCFTLGQLQLNVSPGNLLTAQNMDGCDSGVGTYGFDLNQKSNDIITDNSLPNATSLLFFETIEDAVNNTNSIDAVYESADRIIYFRTDDNSSICASGSFNLIINPLPFNSFEEEIIMCPANFPITLDSTIPSNELQDYNFEWSTGEINDQVIINDGQTISVKVINKLTFCEATKTYNVIKTSNPVISNVEININSRKVTVLTTDNLGNLYALDDPNGFYQNENVFLNVAAGVHIVYVKNENNCSIVEQKIYVLGFPKFFTPNNDSENDSWKIKGLNINDFAITTIYVFDRYGKLLKTLNPGSKWDGIFNGTVLPATDYWFTTGIVDRDNNTKEYIGHFSLIH